MSAKYGDDSTANRKLNSWQQGGVWKKILQSAVKSAHRQNKTSLKRISAGSSPIPSKNGGDAAGFDGFKGMTGTKIHAAAEQNGLPISIATGSANAS